MDRIQMSDTDAQPSRRQLLRGVVVGGLALLAGSALAACGAGASANQPAAGADKSAAAQTSAKPDAKSDGGATVEMNDQNKFVPETITVKKGTAVTWKNTGTMVHNVVTDPALAIDKAHAKVPNGAKTFTSPLINGGGTWSHTFDVAGEYTYFCQPHEALGMVAKVVVTE